jgi:protein Tex
VTATPILENLAREFKAKLEYVHAALDMIDAGLTAPFIGRYRRQQVGGLSESFIRRLDRRRDELEELDRRKGTILRLLEKEEGIADSVKEQIQACMERFEVEDLFLPHRRPEPEVQLALDRGLGTLADLLTASVPKEKRLSSEPASPEAAPLETQPEGAEGAPAVESDSPVTEESEASESAPEAAEEAPAPVAGDVSLEDSPPEPVDPVSEPSEAGEAAPAPEATQTSAETIEAPAADQIEAPAADQVEAPVADQQDGSAEPPSAEPVAPPEGKESASAAEPAAPSGRSEEATAEEVLSAELARLCSEFVSPDKGVHNESEALAGAMRILSDRLGRNPRLRSTLRKMMRKHGILTVRPLVDEKKAGRHKGLLKINQPMRQIQGNRLLAIRQAQKERILATRISMDTEQALEKVRQALGKHLDPAVHNALNEVCHRALTRRLLPMIEEDIRLELKERADAEALRFLSQHLRQLFLTPVLPRRARVVGVDVNAKGDWTFVPLDEFGNPISKDEVKIETGAKDAAALGVDLKAALESCDPDSIAISSGKNSRAAVQRMRAAFTASGLDAFVFIATEAGLSSYANSEVARTELPEMSISQRMAVSLGRRLQDPMFELLKVDPRHLSLGSEQALVSKANVRRCFAETVESCVAHVGCEVNHAPLHFLAALPGLDRQAAEKIVARREQEPIKSRDELRDEGILTEAQWASSAGFLRIYQSPEPLDRSNLHPEQYMLARQLVESVGGTMSDALGRPGGTRGLKREEFEIDPDTWRDLMRELAHPGRDPRHRLFAPRLLDADCDAAVLTRDRVIEGVVSNVTSFGAFVDVGLAQDAIIHISEISDHYVRDARELVSVGQVVRARILEGGDKRLTLSLKGVPREARESRGRRGGARRRGRGRGRGGRDEGPRGNPNLRAAQSRRDGLGGTGGGSGRRGGGRRGRGGRPGNRRDREGDAERVDLKKLNQAAKETQNNPFAAFFNDDSSAEDS